MAVVKIIICLVLVDRSKIPHRFEGRLITKMITQICFKLHLPVYQLDQTLLMLFLSQSLSQMCLAILQL